VLKFLLLKSPIDILGEEKSGEEKSGEEKSVLRVPKSTLQVAGSMV
jgi:hypothetical protein